MPGGSGRKRIQSRQRSIQGGGGIVTGTANLSWGPAFGRGVGVEELQCACSALPINSVALDGTKTCGCRVTVDAWDLNYGVFRTCGCSLTGLGDLALDYGAFRTCGCDILSHEVDLDYGAFRTLGAHALVDAVALDSTKTLGAHLSGDAVGAPFWQSEAHTFGAAGSAATVTVTKPAGTVDGDLLLMHVSAQNAVASGIVTFTLPSGFTTISNTTFSGTASIFRSATCWRIASGEGASYDVTPSGTGHQGLLIEVHRIAGAHATTPIDSNSVATLAATALDPDPDAPSVTTTQPNCLVFAFVAHDHAALSQSHTAAANHVERTDFEKTDAAAIKLSLSSQTKVFPTGATGTVAFNCTETVATDAMMQRVAVAPGTTTLAA